MLLLTLWIFAGVTGWSVVSCSVICPDGLVCPDVSTCCPTSHGYGCCAYPQAVCCADKKHCCPSGYRCNLVTQMCQNEDQPWMNVPMVKKAAAEDPAKLVPPVSPLQKLDNSLIPDQSEVKKSSIVHCDNFYYCPDGTTCCRYPSGYWYCCTYSPGFCCRDGYHCCPFGYHCDTTFRYCVRQNLRYPFIVNQAELSVPASHISTLENKDGLQKMPMMALIESNEVGVIRCDSQMYCPAGYSCCKTSTGLWNCCPYKLGKCCADGKHCCDFDENCDPSSMTCQKGYIQVPSETIPAEQD